MEISYNYQSFFKVIKPNKFVTTTDVKFKLLPNIYFNFWRMKSSNPRKKIVIGLQWLFWNIYVQFYWSKHF